jgi:hypothetical protein
MSVDLSSYPSIWTSLFVRLDVEDLGVLRFSDHNVPYTINSESYAALGSLMNVSDSTTELRLSESEVTITLSGIPTTNIDTVLDYKMKGSPVTIYRGIFNPNTGAALVSPMGKFKGIGQQLCFARRIRRRWQRFKCHHLAYMHKRGGYFE